MKNIGFILAILFFATVGCEKEEEFISSKDILGYWKNLSNDKDTLFINDSVIWRSHLNAYHSSIAHYYTYKVKEDSIILNYEGADKIAFIKPFIHKISLNKEKQILTIENLKSAYPAYNGDDFKFYKNIE